MEGDTENSNVDFFDNTVNSVMDLLNFKVIPRNQKPADKTMEELMKNLSSEREKRIQAENKLLQAELTTSSLFGEIGNFMSKLFGSLTVDPLSRSYYLRVGTFKSKDDRDEWVVKLRNLGANLQENFHDNQDKLKLLKGFNENSMSFSKGSHVNTDPPSENGLTVEVPPNSSPSSSSSPSKYKTFKRIPNQGRLALKHGINLEESSATKHVCICGNEFGKLKNLRIHIRRTNWSEWKYNCEICGKRFFLPSDLKRHMENVEHLKANFFCFYCQYTFEREQELLNHIRFTHKIGSVLVSELRKNTIDGESSSTSSSRRHEEVERNNQDGYLCVCGFKSVSKTTLKYHMRLMGGDKNSVHKPCTSTSVEKEPSNGNTALITPLV